MTDNASSFGSHAALYVAGRPTYPEELFSWIAEQAPGRDAVWDCATGNGQAAVSLAQHFGKVLATDISEGQLAQAPAHPCIAFSVGPAEASGLPQASVDAVTVATALHWFDFSLFWDEVSRVARPGGLFCAWTYDPAVGEGAAQTLLLDPILELVDPYWSEGNRLSWRGYPRDEISFPFEEITPPSFDLRPGWDVDQLAAFVATWSAVTKARDEGYGPQLDELIQRAKADLAGRSLEIKMPLTVVAGRIG